MDNRKTLPETFTFKPFTADDLSTHAGEIERHLNLEAGSIETLLASDSWQVDLNAKLEAYIEDKINWAHKQMFVTTAIEDPEDPLISTFMTQKKDMLEGQVTKLMNYLETKKSGVIAATSEEFANYKERFVSDDGCTAGNHAAALEVLKKNLAIEILLSAHSIADTWKDNILKDTSKFNLIFFEFADIDETGDLTLKTDIIDKFANSNLAVVQNVVSAVFESIHNQDCGHFIGTIRSRVLNAGLADKHGLALSKPAFTLENRRLTFSDEMQALENHAMSDSIEAGKIVHALKSYRENTLRAFSEDQHYAVMQREFYDADYQANKDIEVFRDIIAARDEIFKDINITKQQIESGHHTILDLSERDPKNSEFDSRLMLANLNLTQDHRAKFIEGLEQAQNKMVTEFRQEAEFEKMLRMRGQLMERVDEINREFDAIIHQSFAGEPPLKMPEKELEHISRLRKDLVEIVAMFKKVVGDLQASYQNYLQAFYDARKQLIEILHHSQTDFLLGDLEQRLEATKDDLSDLADQYDKIEAFKGTSLDDTLVDYLYDMRVRNDATQDTLKPEFVPPQYRPEAETVEQPKRMSLGKKILIGAAVGAGIVLAAAATIGIIIATQGIAAAALVGFFAAALTTLKLGGLIGACVGVGVGLPLVGAGIAGMIGAAQNKYHQKHDLIKAPENVPNSNLSTALIAKHMRTKDLSNDIVAEHANPPVTSHDESEHPIEIITMPENRVPKGKEEMDDSLSASPRSNRAH